MKPQLHEKFMRQALELALKAKGKTSPNPLVGALVVKHNKIIARGFHHKAGLAHAEVLALNQAGRRAKGATLYVSLEPCCHYGRTPPCIEKIIKSKVSRVVIGMKDPNPKVNGKGMKILRSHGIDVVAGFLEEDLARINESYIKYITKHLPFVVVKVAQSLDGKISTHTGDSQWITSKDARDFSRKLRNNFDAIMVGVNTLLKDNPNLKPQTAKQNFYKIIVDSKLQTHIDAKILFPYPERVIIATTKFANKDKARFFSQRNIKVWVLADTNGRVDLKVLLSRLAGYEISSVFVEGGGTLIGSLFDQRLVDKVMFFLAPKIIGGRDAISSVMGEGVKLLKNALNIKELQIRMIGKDILIEGYIK